MSLSNKGRHRFSTPAPASNCTDVTGECIGDVEPTRLRSRGFRCLHTRLRAIRGYLLGQTMPQRDAARFSCRIRKRENWDRNRGFCPGGPTRRASAGIHRWSRNKDTGTVRPYRRPRSASEPKLQDRHPSDPTFHAYELLGARRGDASANPYPPRYFTLFREAVALLLWALKILGTSLELSIDLDQRWRTPRQSAASASSDKAPTLYSLLAVVSQGGVHSEGATSRPRP
jgi:hypothetical protein